MKQTVKFLSVCVLLLFLCGCSGILGGTQERNMAEYVQVMTDVEHDYYAYSLWKWEGYFQNEDGAFVLSENPYPDDTLLEAETDTRIVMDARRSGLMQDLISGLTPEDAFLEEGFRQLMEEENYFECRIYEKNGEYFGFVNCYRRCAGRSGFILAYEDLKYSRLLTVEGGQLVFGEEMEKTALLACNDTHYIAYRNKKIFSVRKSTGLQTEILKDQWWDTGPTYYSYVDFYHTENVFYMCGRQDAGLGDAYSLYACYMDGTGLQQLLYERE